MGLVLCVFLIFILAPAIIILMIVSITKGMHGFEKRFLKAFSIYILGLTFIISILFTLKFIFSKSKVKANNLYGDYIIDKSKFDPIQAKWQYEHFKFTLTKDNKMLFHIMENEKILRTITTDFEIRNGYYSARLKLKNENPTFHILYQNPTLYRTTWSFYYVFYSPLYGNMFFKKANWFGN